MLRRAPAGQAHSQPQALTHDGTLQKYVVAEVTHLAGNDLIGQGLDPLVYRPLRVVGHPGHLPEDSMPDLLDPGLYSSHETFVPFTSKLVPPEYRKSPFL